MSVATLSRVELPDLAGVFEPATGGFSDAELAEGLRKLGRLASRVEARRAELLAEADRRGLARRHGFASTTAWLMALSGDPASVCRSRLAVATSLQEMPETRAAFAAGEVSEPRVRLLAEAHRVAPEQFTRDEARLVAQAVSVSPRRLPQALGEWRRRTDPDGAEADTEQAFPPRPPCLAVVVGDGAPGRRPGPRRRQCGPGRPALPARGGRSRPPGHPHPAPVPGRCARGDMPAPPRRQRASWQPTTSSVGNHPLADP